MKELVAKNIQKEFKNINVLNIEQIKFEKGKIYGIFGHNGAGKTTFLKIIFNEYKLNGTITMDDNPLSFENYKEMFFFCDNTDLPKNIKVSEYFRRFFLLIGKKLSEYKKWMKERTNRIQFNFFNNKINELSSGQQKLISLLCIEIMQPEFIFFDEPTANLDIANKETIINKMVDLKKQGKCVIVITHLFSEVKDIIDYFYVISKGKIIFEGNESAKDLIKQKVKESTEGLEF